MMVNNKMDFFSIFLKVFNLILPQRLDNRSKYDNFDKTTF